MTIRAQFVRLLFFLLLPFYTVAQHFQYQAQVKPVAQSGYHRLELPPDVLGRLHNGLGDLRLFDSQQREVPYLLTRQTGSEATAFKAFEVVTKTNVPNVATTLVVRRATRQPIQLIGVEMQNTNVGKKAALSGSNDGTNWYALDESVWLGRNSNSSTTTTLQTISFPLSDYAYFRLVVNDSTSAPLNIRRVGSYGQTNASARYTPIPGLQFTQQDSSDHYTYLMLDRASPARIDRLTIHVSSPAQFRRQVTAGYTFMETGRRKRHRRGKRGQSIEPLPTFTLSSSGDTSLQLPGVLTERLYLRIANGDDPPLQIRAIEAAQLTTYLTASLQANAAYQLQFGSNTALEPAYDLAYFKNQLSGKLPSASLGPLTDESGRSLTDSSADQPGQYAQYRYAVWAATGVVLLLLGFMTYRLLQETGSQRRKV